MIGYPLAIYLDEPSAGIDPSSRRRIYRAIKRAKHSDQIVVIASHRYVLLSVYILFLFFLLFSHFTRSFSLRECEDLCDRVSIIQSGALKRIGKVSELKRTYATGYTIIVKLYPINDYDKQTDLLTADIIAKFGKSCQLKDRRLVSRDGFSRNVENTSLKHLFTFSVHLLTGFISFRRNRSENSMVPSVFWYGTGENETCNRRRLYHF